MRKIDNKSKNYLLKLAKDYEENGFPLHAARIYENIKPKEAKKIYLSTAQEAEKKHFLTIAAEHYSLAEEIRKSKAMWKRLGHEVKKKGLNLLAKEALEMAKPRRRRYKDLAWIAGDLTINGKFKEAKKYLIRSAKYKEERGDFRTALYHYFHGGDIKSAKRVWKKFKELK
jgi:hypothetical protein